MRQNKRPGPEHPTKKPEKARESVLFRFLYYRQSGRFVKRPYDPVIDSNRRGDSRIARRG